MLRLTILLLLTGSTSWSQISQIRQKQLDSVVTNIDRQVLRKLDTLHSYLHAAGDNDEERVFMYYGMFGIHYTYDHERRKQSSRQAKEYTPYYTAQRKKGVCRDFAILFKELCDRSEIPCIVATGRTDVPFFQAISEFFKGRLHRSNHAWNVVQFGGKWRLMDVTWTDVSRTERYYSLDKSGNRTYLGKVKRPNRKYYDASFEVFYSNRNADHPSYYANDVVFTHKSQRKKPKHREVLYEEYAFEGFLDSLSSNAYYKFHDDFYSESLEYSRNSNYAYFMRYQWLYLDLKRSRDDRISIQDCDSHLKEMEEMVAYLNIFDSNDYTEMLASHRQDVLEYKCKLQRKEEMKIEFR